MANSPDATSKESGVFPPAFNYMRQSHPTWTRCHPCWNGRYVFLLSSLPIKVKKSRNTSLYIEAKGYDRSLLSHLIPYICPEVSKVGFNGTRLLLHLETSSSDSSSSESESFQSRFSAFSKLNPISFPPTRPEDVLQITDEEDRQIQGFHLRQFHHLCRKVQQAFFKQRKKTSVFLVGPFVDRHLAKILVRSMDPRISPVLSHRSPDGRITFTRKGKVNPLEVDLPYFPPFFLYDENRQMSLQHIRQMFISRSTLEQSVECVLQDLTLTPPTLEQLYAMAREYFVKSPEGENTISHLLTTPTLIFPFRVFLKELYYELVIVDAGMVEKNMRLQALIQVLKQFLSKKNPAMQTLTGFLDFFESVSDKEIKNILMNICGGKKFLGKLRKLKNLPFLEKEAASIRNIHNLTFEPFLDEAGDVVRNITPKKVIRSIFPDNLPLWQMTINGIPFSPDPLHQEHYFHKLIREISLNFRDGKMRNIEEETTRLFMGAKINERVDTTFRNGRVIRLMDSDAFPILQCMTIEAWGPADALFRRECPRVFENFHFRRKKSQTQLCDIKVNTKDDFQVTHKYAYVLFEQLSVHSTGTPYATMTLEWTVKTPIFQGELKITDFAFTPELEAEKNATKIKLQIFEAFLAR